MLKFLRRLVCSHTYTWSERRAGHYCRDCGHFRADPSARQNVRGVDRA